MNSGTKHSADDGGRGRADALLSGTLWSGFAIVAPKFATLVTTPIIVHDLGLPRLGLIAFVGALSAFLSIMVNGMTGAAQRRLAILLGAEDLVGVAAFVKKTLWVATLSSLPIALLMFGLADTLTTHVLHGTAHVHEGVDYVRLQSAAGLLAPASGIGSAVLLGQRRFRLLGIASTVSAIGSAIVTAALVQSGHGLRSIGLISLAVQLLMSGFIFIKIRKSVFGQSKSAQKNKQEFQNFWRFSAQISLVNSLATIDQSSDALLIGATQRGSATGLYGIGAGASQTLRSLSLAALSPLLIEILTTFGAGGRQAAGDLFVSTQRVWVRICTIFSVVSLGFSYFAVEVWLGPGYSRAALLCMLLVFGDMVNLWTGALTCFLNAIGRVDIEARYGIAAVILNCVGTAGLLYFGTVGIVIGTVIGEILGSLLLIRLARPHLLESERRTFVQEVPWRFALITFLFAFPAAYFERLIVPSGTSGLFCMATVAATILFSSLSCDETLRRIFIQPRLRRLRQAIPWQSDAIVDQP